MNPLSEPAICPAQEIIKGFSGKLKPALLRLATQGPLRFNTLLRLLPDTNKQSLALALADLVTQELLTKTVVQQKPLHIEYSLAAKGQAVVKVLEGLEAISQA